MTHKDDLLKRFFQNRYSRNDYLELKKLLLSGDPELGGLMQAHWAEFNPEPMQQKDLTQVLVTITRELDQRSPRLVRKLARGWSRVAAVLLLPLFLLSGLLYLQFRHYLTQKEVFVEVASPAGSRTTLNLPDGSAVWLNGNSRIRYPAVFGENRKVHVSGEAFFSVKSDRENPFLVRVNDLYVRATGTEFNVLAYPGEPVVGVILKEGQVTVLDAGESVLREMEAGYGYRYDQKSATGRYRQLNADTYSDWIRGRLIFENATMKEVIKRMEHWYGVNIEVKDPELLQLHFKATFVNESIEEALKLLQSTATFHYRFVNREIRADGTRAEAKIVISRGSG